MSSKRQVHTWRSFERKRVNESVELSGCWKGRCMVGASIRSDGDPRLARVKIDLKRDVIFDALALSESRARTAALVETLAAEVSRLEESLSA